jgi:hypothetical protein
MLNESAYVVWAFRFPFDLVVGAGGGGWGGGVEVKSNSLFFRNWYIFSQKSQFLQKKFKFNAFLGPLMICTKL